MPEFFTVLPPDEALARLFAHLPPTPPAEIIPVAEALDRVTFEAIRAPASLPAFPRSMMDGYAVRAQDTFGASQSLVDAPELIDASQVGRRGDERHGPRLAERRLADFDETDVWTHRGQSPEVLDRLTVGEEL